MMLIIICVVCYCYFCLEMQKNSVISKLKQAMIGSRNLLPNFEGGRMFMKYRECPMPLTLKNHRFPLASRLTLRLTRPSLFQFVVHSVVSLYFPPLFWQT